ncbi:hypothetical protein AB0J72_47905 [Dactylosporangium sp. NPDC049742]|uniref:hypothetical protein n=1 Tax=Dactylosporangium sp. NPDC049742 TaxID=3154737 RepID=UPI003420474E
MLHRLPRISWQQNSSWRRRAADAARKLADDVANGRLVKARCVAEDLFLRLAMEDAEDDALDAVNDPGHPSHALPMHLDDYLWDLDDVLLLRDSDLLLLDDPRSATSVDPGAWATAAYRSGAVAPDLWFEPFPRGLRYA